MEKKPYFQEVAPYLIGGFVLLFSMYFWLPPLMNSKFAKKQEKRAEQREYVDSVYHVKKDSLKNIYQIQIDSLKKERKFQLKNLDDKFE
jgi:hypothetical protein